MRFRRKERGTRVKDREKSGSRFISRAVKTESPLPQYFFAPKPNGNACYAGYWKNYFGPWKVLDFPPQNSVWTMIRLGARDAWEDRCINQRPIQTAFYKLHSSSIRNSSVGLFRTCLARSLNTAFSERWNCDCACVTLTCENIRFSSLFAAGDVSRGGTSSTQGQKFHTDDANQCLLNRFGSHGFPNVNLFSFRFLLVDFVFIRERAPAKLKCLF